jgi:GT2 family glycosyltransferase
MPTLALITVLYKSDEVLEDFFSGISKQSYTDYKLYLIDNSFNDTSTALIHSLLKRYPVQAIEHINAGGNIGVAAGNNLGIHHALKDRCSSLVFLNNDIYIPQEDLLERTVALCETHKMVTPKIYYHNSDLIWMAGGFISHAKAIGVHYGMKQKDTPSLNEARYVTYAPTCYLAVHRSIIDEVGLMDERYFAYYDDTDFVLRALHLGYRIWYEPALHINHKVSSSSGGDDSLFYIYYGNRNKLIFIRKHYKGLHKLYLFTYYFIVRFFFYYLRFDPQRKRQLIKAAKDGLALPL